MKLKCKCCCIEFYGAGYGITRENVTGIKVARFGGGCMLAKKFLLEVVSIFLKVTGKSMQNVDLR